jgi:hypothetical protein
LEMDLLFGMLEMRKQAVRIKIILQTETVAN